MTLKPQWFDPIQCILLFVHSLVKVQNGLVGVEVCGMWWSISYSVIQWPRLLPTYTRCFSRSESSPFSQWAEIEYTAHSTGGFSWARPGIGTHYFCPHSCGQNAVTWLCLTSMKRARMCPTARQDRELFEAGQSFFCCILPKVCEKMYCPIYRSLNT